MLISPELRAAAEKCFAMAYPFAVVLMPQSENAVFFACEKAVFPGQTHGNFFLIGRFGCDASRMPLAILPQYSVADILSIRKNTETDISVEITEQSTDRDTYRKIINNVVNDMPGQYAKVVIARQIIAETSVSPLEIAEEYFTQFPTCMRSIFYTPQTGLWITSTPEVLIDYRSDISELNTMSLAGTRRRGETDWDLKNCREHEIVTDYIVSILESAGMEVHTSGPESISFGCIEHLCNRIRATGKINPVELAISLSPTPAVGGWPVADALKTIAHYENFDRGCYGGFLGIVNNQSCHLYVNLRCGQLLGKNNNNFTWRLISGGGITSMSDADTEWAETENKISPLLNILTEKTLSLT